MLRIFCLSDTLPSSVLELVSSKVVEIAVSGHILSTAERLRVLKVMVPFTPARSPVAWATDPQDPAERPTTAEAQEAGRPRHPFVLTERDRRMALASSCGMAGIDSHEARRLLGTGVLPSEVTSHYGRLERSAAALVATNEIALSRLVPEISRLMLGCGTAVAPDRAAFVGNVLGGALTMVGASERGRHLRVLARAYEEATMLATNAAGSAAAIDRLLSWPAVSCDPAFSPYAHT